jgi:hypothetical protein
MAGDQAWVLKGIIAKQGIGNWDQGTGAKHLHEQKIRGGCGVMGRDSQTPEPDQAACGFDFSVP